MDWRVLRIFPVPKLCAKKQEVPKNRGESGNCQQCFFRFVHSFPYISLFFGEAQLGMNVAAGLEARVTATTRATFAEPKCLFTGMLINSEFC